MSTASIQPVESMAASAEDLQHYSSTTNCIDDQESMGISPNNLDFPSKRKHETPAWYRRQDVWMLVSGMGFILVMLAMMAVVGNARGWDADTSLEHNETESSQDRFQDEPYIEEPGVRGRYGKDAVARWYYWKLKPELTSFWTHFFPWFCYTLHVAFIWISIYYTQMKKATEPLGPGRYSSNLSPVNYVSFGINALFHLLHFLCTHMTYDGLAQDVSISTSQSSVTMALCLIILLEYKERGIFFGWPTTRNTDKISNKMRWDYAPINIIRRYHGYAIGWAAIYTCWYHPMENTIGHLLGFFYTWIIMLQGSLIYTDMHLNKYWRLLLEAWVIAHSGIIAAQTGGDEMLGTRLWPRFVFGFSLALVITQIFGLPFWVLIPTWCRIIPLLLYAAVTLWAYSWIPDEDGNTWVRLPEIFTVPSSYYIFFVYGWVILYFFIKIERKVYGYNIGINVQPLSRCKQALYLCAAVFIFVILTSLAIACEYMDWIAGLVTLMLGFVAIFMFGTLIAFMLLRRTVPLRTLKEPTETDNLDKSELPKQEQELTFSQSKGLEQSNGISIVDPFSENKAFPLQTNEHKEGYETYGGVPNGQSNTKF